MQHKFDVAIAKKYDITTALLLENFYFWIEKNRANKKNFHDGRYWTYNSFKALTELFPYLSERQLKYAIKKLIAENLLIQANYNENPYDRTSWYALTDLGYSIVQNCPMYNEQNCPMNYNSTDNYSDNIKTNKEKDNTDVLSKKKKKFIPPTLEEVQAYAQQRGREDLAQTFFEYFNAGEWYDGNGKPVRNWKQKFVTWETHNPKKDTQPQAQGTPKPSQKTYSSGVQYWEGD